MNEKENTSCECFHWHKEEDFFILLFDIAYARLNNAWEETVGRFLLAEAI